MDESTDKEREWKYIDDYPPGILHSAWFLVLATGVLDRIWADLSHLYTVGPSNARRPSSPGDPTRAIPVHTPWSKGPYLYVRFECDDAGKVYLVQHLHAYEAAWEGVGLRDGQAPRHHTDGATPSSATKPSSGIESHK